MGVQEHVVFLHGIGVGPDSWDDQIAALPHGYSGYAPRIAGLTNDDEAAFTLIGAANDVVRDLDRRGIDRAHICGLSLGAMVAVQVAIGYPDRVASLMLAGGQVHPPRALMAIQSAVMRILPARLVAPDGTSKQRVLATLAEVARVDFRPDLARITAPTLVLCGSKDAANLPAARALAAGIPNARLSVIDGGGHELNTHKPREFSTEVVSFLQQFA